jgi:hypothetical protein
VGQHKPPLDHSKPVRLLQAAALYREHKSLNGGLSSSMRTESPGRLHQATGTISSKKSHRCQGPRGGPAAPLTMSGQARSNRSVLQSLYEGIHQYFTAASDKYAIVFSIYLVQIV